MKISKFQNYEEFLRAGVKLVEDFLNKKVAENGMAVLGLAGGKTPSRLYAKMAKSSVDWGRVKTFLIDERVVPWTDEKSNYRLVKENLYTELNAANLNNFFDFETEIDHMEAVVRVQNKFHDEGKGRLDLVILGVGPDGHFASVFPRYVRRMADLWGGWTQTEQFEVKERLTMSPKTIKAAGKIVVWLAGPDKKAILDELENGTKSVEEFPIKYLAGHPDLEIYYCEKTA